MPEVGGIAGDRLRSFIQRIERLEEEKKTIAVDIREVYAEAKSNGFDPKIMRQVIKLRAMETADRQEQEALLETYLAALGMTDIEEAIDDAGGEPGGLGRGEKKVAARPSRKLKAAIDGLGTPVALTEEEKARGGVAAFEKDGNRMSIAFPERATEDAGASGSENAGDMSTDGKPARPKHRPGMARNLAAD